MPTEKAHKIRKGELTLANYFSREREHVSRSMLTDYLKSPEFYKKKYIDRIIKEKFTAPMQRGSMVDYILTQQVGENAHIMPYVRKVLKKDDPEQYEIQKEIDPRYLVTPDLFDQAITVAEEIYRQPFWQQNLKTAKFQQVLEGYINDTLVCGLPDRIDPLVQTRYRMVDVKVVNPIKISSPQKWYWNAWESGYVHQAALYQNLFAAEQGIPAAHIEFCHAVGAPVSSNHAISEIYKLPQRDIDKAMGEIVEALEGIKAGRFEPVLKDWTQVVDLGQVAIQSPTGLMTAEEEAEELEM